MQNSHSQNLNDQFFSLTPEQMLDSVEHALDSKRTGIRATGRCLALNSMENRVYEIELDDNSSVVAKFYRPGRWTSEAILEEHQFIHELALAEVPAVAPRQLANGSTLATSSDGIFFAVFPKTRGRILQELADDQLAQIGRLLARLHNVGANRKATHRIELNPMTYGTTSIELLERSQLIHGTARGRYLNLAKTLVQNIGGIWKTQSVASSAIRLHGDCHLGNVLWSHTAPFFLDFDDMVTGPPVQDIWLIVRGRDDEAKRQRDVLLAGYEQMRDFDYGTLNLIEPLRTLRMIHYAAWIARRWDDPTFKNAFPEFTTERFWLEETQTLQEQFDLMND